MYCESVRAPSTPRMASAIASSTSVKPRLGRLCGMRCTRPSVGRAAAILARLARAERSEHRVQRLGLAAQVVAGAQGDRLGDAALANRVEDAHEAHQRG